MSGAASIPLMGLALIFQGSPRKWLAILAFVGLWIFCIKLMLKVYAVDQAPKQRIKEMERDFLKNRNGHPFKEGGE